ncbi:hypothetical protein FZC83_01970 [Rossellomorea marisflavi]|uniref:Uncharacterized protein n=1 Tax=Rossellomorea marisflavi TaxID=189381 RepID=A0A5D4S3C1_9BACI|nr:hypothetical protein [Rossellomorea marisflavi]TYS56362.1 hypothetical protein FZC83_01970 [Rossellomorea marisflavi]
MKSTLKKLDGQQSLIEFQTSGGVNVLEINATEYGYTYEDFTNWDITDDEYYDSEDETQL